MSMSQCIYNYMILDVDLNCGENSAFHMKTGVVCGC